MSHSCIQCEPAFIDEIRVTNKGWFTHKKNIYRTNISYAPNRSVILASLPGDPCVMVAYGDEIELCNPISKKHLLSNVKSKQDVTVISDLSMKAMFKGSNFNRTKAIRLDYDKWLPKSYHLANRIIDIMSNEFGNRLVKLLQERKRNINEFDIADVLTSTGIQPIFTRLYGAFYIDVISDAGKTAQQIVKQGLRIDKYIVRKQDDPYEFMFNPWSAEHQEWIDTRTATLVTGITKETVTSIKTIIEQGIADGAPINHISKRIKQVVGLNNQQTEWLRNYELMLDEAVKQGKISSKRVDSLISRYSNKLHNLRATTIARTEVMQALNYGALKGYEQSFVTEVIWSTAPGACPQCTPYEGEVYKVNDVPALTIHPNCRCTVIPKIDSMQFPEYGMEAGEFA